MSDQQFFTGSKGTEAAAAAAAEGSGGMEGTVFQYSDDENDDKIRDEEGGPRRKDGGVHDSDSDSSAASSTSPSSSYKGEGHWPQSYRGAIDLYSNLATPPPISSIIHSSLRSTPDIFSSLRNLFHHDHHLQPQDVEEEKEEEEEEEEETEDEKEGEHEEHQEEPETLQEDALHKPLLSDHEHPLYGHQKDDQERESGCSFGHAVLNGMNVLCGVGILSTPYAVKEGGWADLAILILFAVLAWYTGILLSKCLGSGKRLGHKALKTYPDIAEAAFGYIFRVIVSIILYAELYACCVEYVILESDNMSAMFPNAHIDIAGFHLSSPLLFALLATLVVLPTTWIKEQEFLSYISVVGVAASIIVVLCLLWVGAVDNVGFKHKGTSLRLPGIPIAVGIYGYCYSGHAVFPNIYTSMKRPSEYPFVLFAAFLICTVMFAGSAVMGYAMFGESTESQFTLNMPKSLLASNIAVWTTVVNPLTKFSLTINPFAEGLEELIPRNHPKTRTYQILIRSGLVLSTLLFALGVPFFGLVMALIGSLLTMLVTFIFPCLCFLRITKSQVSLPEKMLCIFTMAVGAISCVFGTYSSSAAIIDNWF